MKFTFTIEVEVERSQGPFASREELAGLIIEALEGTDPGEVETDNGGQYEVTVFDVAVVDQPRRSKRGAQKASAALAPVPATVTPADQAGGAAGLLVWTDDEPEAGRLRRPANMLGGPFTAPVDPTQRWGA